MISCEMSTEFYIDFSFKEDISKYRGFVLFCIFARKLVSVPVTGIISIVDTFRKYIYIYISLIS